MAPQILSPRTGPLLTAAALIAVLALALAAPPHANAQAFYRWVSSEGTVQLSDRPPPHGIEYEVVSPQTSTSRSVGANQGTVPPTTRPSVSNPFEPRADRPVMSQEKNPELCRRARDNLFWLENRARVRSRNTQGDLVMLTPEETAEQRREAQRVIDQHCE